VGHTQDEAKVRTHQSLERWLRTELRESRQANFFLRTDERCVAGCS
jgi:hypothetical protein